MFADDVAAFMSAMGIPQAHISGLSLGAATGIWLASKHPGKVKSLSLHSAWTKTDAYARTVVEGWQVMAKALGSVPELVIRGIFPWCLTPDLYANRPEYIQALSDFVRSRPAQPVEAFIAQSDAVLAYDVEAQLANIQAPTQITFGRRDLVTSTRFAEPLKNGIRNSELVVFEGCSHAMIYERTEEFNTTTLEFLERQAGRAQRRAASYKSRRQLARRRAACAANGISEILVFCSATICHSPCAFTRVNVGRESISHACTPW